MRSLIACALLIPASLAPAIGDETGDEPVALVNGRPIPRSDFDMAVQLQFSGKQGNRMSLGELRAVREQVLERLIDSELIYQQASEQGVRVKEKDVTAEVEKIRGRFESEEAFRGILESNATTEKAFREQMRRSLMISRFVENEVMRGIRIRDEDVRRYYEQNPAEMTRSESVPIRQILVRVDPDASGRARAAAREKIEAILTELRAGADFGEMARRYSDGPGASEGGSRGVLIRGGGAPPILERAAFALSAGEISDVIETQRGFHLLMVGERLPSGPVPFDEAKDRIRAVLESNAREEAMRAFADSLRERATIERLLAETP